MTKIIKASGVLEYYPQNKGFQKLYLCIVNYILFEAIHLYKMFGFNITSEHLVGPIIIFGASWVVKTIKFIKFYT